MQKFIRTNASNFLPEAIVGFGDQHRAHGKIDSGGETSGRHNHPELPQLGQWLDDSGTQRVVQTTVVVSDSPREKFAERAPNQRILLGSQLEGFTRRKRYGKTFGDFLRDLALGGENENRAESSSEGLGDATGPVSTHTLGNLLPQGIEIYLLLRNGTFGTLYELHLAAEASEPIGNQARVRRASAEEEELRLRRSAGDRQLVVKPSERVVEHLILVDDQQLRSFATQQSVSLGLESRYDHRGGEIVGEVSCGDPDIPPTRPPLH